MTSEQTTVLVIAGNYRQFAYWCEQQGLRRDGMGNTTDAFGVRYRYIADELRLLGYDRNRILLVVATGTYWENPCWRSERMSMMRPFIRYDD